MKSKEEIEQLAEQYIKDNTGDHYVYCGYIDGYNQCQEDMMEFLESEIRRAFMHGQGNGQMMEVGLERDEIDDYTNSRMLSLNKKD